MKISLWGCGNNSNELPHERELKHWIGRAERDGTIIRYIGNSLDYFGSRGDPMRWHVSDASRGLVEDLTLKGNYRVLLEFQNAELKNWLKCYIAEKPDEALDLIAEMLPEALKLSRTRQKGEKTCQNKP